MTVFDLPLENDAIQKWQLFLKRNRREIVIYPRSSPHYFICCPKNWEIAAWRVLPGPPCHSSSNLKKSSRVSRSPHIPLGNTDFHKHASLISCHRPNNQSVCQPDRKKTLAVAIGFLNVTSSGYLPSSRGGQSRNDFVCSKFPFGRLAVNCLWIPILLAKYLDEHQGGLGRLTSRGTHGFLLGGMPQLLRLLVQLQTPVFDNVWKRNLHPQAQNVSFQSRA